jgi:hypothetical protein
VGVLEGRFPYDTYSWLPSFDYILSLLDWLEVIKTSVVVLECI